MVDVVLWGLVAVALVAIGYGVAQIVEHKEAVKWQGIAAAYCDQLIQTQRQADLYREQYQQAAMMLDLANKRLDGDGPTTTYARPIVDVEFEEDSESAHVDGVS